MAKRNLNQEESHYHDLRCLNGDTLGYNEAHNASKCISDPISGKKKSWTN